MKKFVKAGLFCLVAMFVSCSDLFIDKEVDAKVPEIVQQPVDVSTTENDTLRLLVKAKSLDGGALFYEWYKAGNEELSDAVLAGDGSEFVDEKPVAGTYYFYCKVTNKNESAMVSGKTQASVDSDVVKVEVAQGKYRYTVEHYLQNLDETFTLVGGDTEVLTGKRESLSQAVAKTYAGFTAKPIEQQEVLQDGTTVVKVYYERKTVTLTFDLKGGNTKTALTNGTLSGKYGAPVVFEQPERTGFVLGTWYGGKTIPGTFPATDETFTAVWIGENGIPYSVEHYQENAQDDGYTIVAEDTESLLGVAGKKTIAKARTYTGFNAKAFEQVDVSGDGSTILKIYYDRKRTKINYELNGGELVEGALVEHKYGVENVLVEPTKKDLTFLGWYDNAQFTGNAVTKIAETNVEKTMYAKYGPAVIFYSNGGSGTMEKQVFVEKVQQNLKTNSFTAPENKVFYAWNTKVDQSGDFYYNEKSISIDKNLNLYAVWNGLNGGLIGKATNAQTQGQVISEGVTHNGELLGKTSEVVVVPTGTVATITMQETTGELFTNERKIKLSPFIMSQYQVTQELYEAVMGKNPSKCLEKGEYPKVRTEVQKYRPVDYVNWFNAIIFCNKLTKKVTGSYDTCVYSYYGEKDPDKWLQNSNLSTTVPISGSATNYENWSDQVKIDLAQTGYRLPTDTEWEFAARGGDPNAACWSYYFAGKDSTSTASSNADLDEVGWYYYNRCNGGTTGSSGGSSGTAGYGTHEVGKKKDNALHLFDMSGNVYEWCNDYYSGTVTVDDEKYKDREGFLINPTVVSASSIRRLRGGCWNYDAYFCSVANSRNGYPCERNYSFGFRLVRSAE